MTTHRVMQEMETGEVCCRIELSEENCHAWIEENADQYPESKFWVEEIERLQFFDDDSEEYEE
jgi:hypothetical protein